MLALYQLSQVFLEQNKTEEAMEAVEKAWDKAGCENLRSSSLCLRIRTQRADVLRAGERYLEAAEVRRIFLPFSFFPLQPFVLPAVCLLVRRSGFISQPSFRPADRLLLAVLAIWSGRWVQPARPSLFFLLPLSLARCTVVVQERGMKQWTDRPDVVRRVRRVTTGH